MLDISFSSNDMYKELAAEGNFKEKHYKAFYTENQRIKIIIR
jgi:hypothetical protein